VQVSGFTVQGAIGEGTRHRVAQGRIDQWRRHPRQPGDQQRHRRYPSGHQLAVSAVQHRRWDPWRLWCGHSSDGRVRLAGDNYVSGNTGGVLLTDEFGPTHDNIVARTIITRNEFDCGVTAPGHSPFALDAKDNRQPAVAGVYDNGIAENWITENGLKGEGAGVLFANATAGTRRMTASSSITASRATAWPAWRCTLTPSAPDSSRISAGNRIIANAIGRNCLGGDPDTGVKDATGVLVLGAVPLTVKIVHNRIFDNSHLVRDRI
jgi:hypothetical protein